MRAPHSGQGTFPGECAKRTASEQRPRSFTCSSRVSVGFAVFGFGTSDGNALGDVVELGARRGSGVGVGAGGSTVGEGAAAVLSFTAVEGRGSCFFCAFRTKAAISSRASSRTRDSDIDGEPRSVPGGEPFARERTYAERLKACARACSRHAATSASGA